VGAGERSGQEHHAPAPPWRVSRRAFAHAPVRGRPHVVALEAPEARSTATGALEPVRVVEIEEGRLGRCGRRTARPRFSGCSFIPSSLMGRPSPRLHEDAARSRTLAARGGVPEPISREIVSSGHLDVGQDLLDRLPGASRRPRNAAPAPDELQEIPARRLGRLLGGRQETPSREGPGSRECRSAPRGSASCAGFRLGGLSRVSRSRQRASVMLWHVVAVGGRLVLAVAADAEAHLQVLGLLDHVPCFCNFPMALSGRESRAPMCH